MHRSSGGTLDITAHEVLENEDIREIYHATGGDFGGTKVDAEFEKLMEAYFGKELMNEFRDKHPSDWLEITTDWETKKRSARAVEGEETRVRLSYSFMNLYEFYKLEREKKPSRLRDWLCFPKRSAPYDLKEVSLRKGHLCLGSDITKKLFEPAISSIIGQIKKILKKSDLADKINYIFLVGGFADCQLLQMEVRKEFEEKYPVLVPEEANLAVVKGAVMFGQKPNIVTERVLAETYGTDTCMKFERCDPEEKRIIVEDTSLCSDRFKLLATVGEVVKTDQRKTISGFYPIYKDQTQCTFGFYTTERPNTPRYTDEEGVKQLSGYVTVDCPVRPEKEDRELELNMYFGGTEIKVTAIDVKSGKNATGYIDFLVE